MYECVKYFRLLLLLFGCKINRCIREKERVRDVSVHKVLVLVRVRVLFLHFICAFWLFASLLFIFGEDKSDYVFV